MTGSGSRRRSWEIVVVEDGVLAWDPVAEVFQRVYIISMEAAD